MRPLTREQWHALAGGLVMALLWTLLWATACSHPTEPAPCPCVQRYWPPIETPTADGSHAWIIYPMEPICPR